MDLEFKGLGTYLYPIICLSNPLCRRGIALYRFLGHLTLAPLVRGL